VRLDNGARVDLATGGIRNGGASVLRRWVVPLVAFDAADGRFGAPRAFLGSAFAIAPRLLVTAKHVVEEILEPRKRRTPYLVKPGTLLCALLPTGTPVIIQGIGLAEENDLALLTIRAGRQFCTAPLTIREGEVGSRLWVVGYPGEDAALMRRDELSLDDQRVYPQVCMIGDVQARHIPQRDSVMVNYPALEADFAALKGMSGGPVVTESGHVCGIVCTAIPPDEDGGGWSSTSALLQYLFAMQVELDLDGDGARLWTIHELAQRGEVRTDGSHMTVGFAHVGDDVRIWFPADGDLEVAEQGIDVNQWLTNRLGKQLDLTVVSGGVLFTMLGALRTATIDHSSGERVRTGWVVSPDTTEERLMPAESVVRYQIGECFLDVPRGLHVDCGIGNAVSLPSDDAQITLQDPDEEE
jgi:hypothetical protein